MQHEYRAAVARAVHARAGQQGSCQQRELATGHRQAGGGPPGDPRAAVRRAWWYIACDDAVAPAYSAPSERTLERTPVI